MNDKQNNSDRLLKKAREIIKQADLQHQNISSMFAEECSSLLDGNLQLLEKRSFAAELPNVLFNIYSVNDEAEFKKYIDQLKKAVRLSGNARENVLLVCSSTMQKLPDPVHEFYLLQLLALSLQFLRVEKIIFGSMGTAFGQMKRFCLQLVKGERLHEALAFLESIALISQGSSEKSPQFVALVKKLQDNIATKEVLTQLVEKYLAQEHTEQTDAAKALLFLGRRAVIFLVNNLVRTEKIRQQNLLIDILARYDRESYEIFNDCLVKNSSAAVIQLILRIYETKSDDESYIYVRPYLSHKDIHIQQRVIHCIAVFDKKRAKARILEAIDIVHDLLKHHLVMLLGLYDGEDVERCLLGIIENRGSIAPKAYEQLLGVASLALKSFPSEKSAAALSSLIKELQAEPERYHHLLYTVENALNYIVPINRHVVKGSLGLLDNVRYESAMGENGQKNKKALEIEEEAVLLIENGEIEKATAFFVEKIKGLAKKKDFATAQYLQNKLLSLNPMALEEVIAAEEFIESEKLLPVSASSFAMLEKFQEHFSADECNALLDCMSSESYDAGEILVRAGEIDPCLYFVDTGKVSVECNSNGRPLFLKTFKASEIMGVGTFFSCAVWTYTMTARSDCDLHVMQRKKYDELLRRYPVLEQSFYQFCSIYDIFPDLIKIAGKDRREYPRFKVDRLIEFRILDTYGNSGNKRFVKCEMADISRAGISYIITVSEKINPMFLLGKMVECSIATIENKNCYARIGTIVAAKDLKRAAKKFSIHVRFQDLLKSEEITEITREGRY